jgi:hypothetical protein
MKKHNLGPLFLKLRLYFKGGPKSIYYREKLRPKILHSAPQETNEGAQYEVHILTGKYDWVNLLWAIKSFVQHCGPDFRFFIHDDGTLDAGQSTKLQSFIPQCVFISRGMSNERVYAELKEFPRCLAFRRNNYLAPKVFDFKIFSDSEKIIVLDSDILFFHRPGVLLDRLFQPSFRLNSFNKNPGFGYAISSSEIRRRFGIFMDGNFNSGLGVLHVKSINYDTIEKLLSDDDIFRGHPHRIEQTLIAACCFLHGHEYLPDDYDVYYGKTLFQKPCRHYFSPARSLLYSEGMPFVAEQILE